MHSSLTLEVIYPWWQSLCRYDHSTCRGKVSLAIVLDLQVDRLSRLERSWQFGSQTEVIVVETDREFALFVKRILEVDTRGLSAR